MTSTASTSSLPAGIGAAITDAKSTLRHQLGDVTGAFAEADTAMRAEVAAVIAERDAGRPIWPVVEFEDIAAGGVPDELRDAVWRRGCAVVRHTFGRERAKAWDAELAAYTERNRFAETYRGLDDGVFGGLAAGKPSIYPIYWSLPQIQARQDEAMGVVRRFLNGFWKHESLGQLWFDPERDAAYPDRVRRRAPGTSSSGLSPHTDSGSVERWLVPGYQNVFRHVFSGEWSEYDPWDGAYRTDVQEFPSTVMCSSFRTFQGWTALSDMRPTEGVLHAVPIPAAMGYVLLRALQDDVADDDLCGAVNGQSLPITSRYHSLLLAALTPIPEVAPGDTVWWHGDLIHSVGSVNDQKGWGNVMYIPAAPYCEKNAAYARACGEDFLTGASPTDFAAEDYERTWAGRATAADLSHVGRSQLGLPAG
jgi:hypothetical protein